MKGGNFNPIPIDRVNKSISKNIRLTYKCHTLLKSSLQGLPIYQHIWLILGDNNNNNLLLNIQNKSDLDEAFTEPSDKYCFKSNQTNS